MKLIASASVIAASATALAARAQSITVVPAAAVPGAGGMTAVPVDNPWSLLALALVLGGAAWWVLRHRQYRAVFMTLWGAFLVSAMLWHSPDLRAQLQNSFTNPAGETQPLDIIPVITGAGLAGFEAEDFTNASSVPLKITSIVNPTLVQCFPAGLSTLQAPGTPPANRPPSCAVGAIIAPNAACRVDVELICRTEAAQSTQTIVLAAAPAIAFAATGTGTLTLTNGGAQAALNVQAIPPSGSGIMVTNNICGPALAPNASCTVTLTAPGAEGPTAVTIQADNASPSTVQVTVTAAPVPQTTLSVSPSTLSFEAGSMGAVLVTNNGSHPALDIVATAGNGITVDSSTCAPVLAPGASCGLTLSAPAATAATPLTIQGSNTPQVSVQVTVTVPQTTLSVLSSSLSFEAGGTGTVQVTNNGSHPALGIVATAGNGITVDSSTCAPVLAPGASCNLTLSAPAATAATSVTIQGSNTSTVTVNVTVNNPGATTEVGAFSLNGNCGIMGLLGPGFTLTAGIAPLPIGTTVTVTGTGIANIGLFSVTGGEASVNALSGTLRQITLTAPLAAGATIAFRTTLSISVAFTLNASLILPPGHVGTGSKPAGSVNSTLVLCSAS